MCIRDRMGRFLVELATVDQMAQEQGVELTSQEEDSLKSLSQEYYAGLTQEDLDYMGVAQDEVYDLYLSLIHLWYSGRRRRGNTALPGRRRKKTNAFWYWAGSSRKRNGRS